MLQAWLVVALSSNFYTVSTMLFHKYVVSNDGVMNWMLQFFMFISTKASMRLSNVNMVHAWGIRNILCFYLNDPLNIQWDQFINFQVTLEMRFHWVPLKVMYAFKMLRQKFFTIVIVWTLQAILGVHPTVLRNIWTIFKSRSHRYLGYNCLCDMQA